MIDRSRRLEIRLLGQLEVLVDGRPVDVPGRRPRALLAVLALAAGEPVPADSLYERVWGHDLPGDVRANLYTCVRRLRKALGEGAIHNEAGRYSLRVDPENVDAVRFTRLLDRARAAGADPEPLLRKALDLWHGAPFGDEQLSDWLTDNESRRLTERWLAAVQQRVDLDLAAGRHDGLAEELEQLTAAYPLREPLWARLLTVLGSTGRQAEALAAYERIRVRLVDELGIDPSPELQSLYAALLRGDSPAPSTAVTAEVPRQLPSSKAGFIGREPFLAQLDELLPDQDDQTRRPVVIAALHGLGGVGKTSLAVHWAHRVARHFPDGQLFVNLRGYGPREPMEPAAALDVLLRGLGIPCEEIPVAPDARSALLRSAVAGKRLMLVLDDARDAEQIRPLLPGSGCLVLVTSRSQLRGLAARDGAHRIAVDALPASEAVALLRARLSATVEDDALLELADLCGRLPLALTIAAERANQGGVVGLGELISELRDEQARLDALADYADQLADVRAVFSWSFHALERDAARLFCQLGLAPAVDIGIEAAAALAGLPVDATRRQLDRLVAASLVSSSNGRFRLHDLVREYAAEMAREELTEEGCAQAQHRLYQWCLRTSTQAERLLTPRLIVLHPDVDEPGTPRVDFGGDRARAVAWIDRETDVLIAVAHAAVEALPWVSVGIAHALWDPLRWNRSWDEALALQECALQAARAVGGGEVEVRALLDIGGVLRGSVDPGAAIAVTEQALALSERIGDLSLRSRVLWDFAFVMRCIGQPGRAVEYQEEALEIEIRLGREWKQAYLRNALAEDLAALSLYDRALAEAEQALTIAERIGTAKEQSFALDTLGEVHHALADYQAAVECFSRAIQLADEGVVPRHRAIILSNLGRSQVAAGRRAEARMSLQSAIRLVDEYGLADSRYLRRTDLVELLAATVASPLAQ